MTVRQLWNRLLALTLVALPLGLGLWTAAGVLYSAHAMLSTQTAETRTHLRRYEAMLARQQETESAVARSLYNGRNRYWSGSTEADAAETLQTQLRAAIDAAGAEIQQIEPPALEPDAEHPSVTLHVTLHATPTELLETLYAMESYRPYLFVDHLYVRAPEKRPRSEDSSEAVLQVSMDVRGYLEATGTMAPGPQ
jgi:Type II secretion system (T2SS), protein M subtype b